MLVSFTEPHRGWSIVHEKSLILIDRALAFGDVVKRRFSDTESGTVVKTSVNCTLRPIYTGLPFSNAYSWGHKAEDNMLYEVPGEELRYLDDYQEGDHIIYHDWVGVVKDVVEEVTVRLDNGSVVVVEDAHDLEIPAGSEFLDLYRRYSLAEILEARYQLSMSDNSKDQDPVPAELFYPGQTVISAKSNLRRGRWVYGTYDPSVNTRAIVVSVRLIQIEVAWLAANVFAANRTYKSEPPWLLNLDDLESGEIILYEQGKIPRVPTPGEVRGSVQGSSIAVGDHVRFNDVAGAAVKYNGSTVTAGGVQQGAFHRIPRTATQGYDMNVFTVRAIKVRVTVQWQDASTSEEDSTALTPYLNVDEHDLWPGEIVELPDNNVTTAKEKTSTDPSKVAKPKRIGVVQSISARERLVRVRWFSNPQVEIFKELILLPGSSMGTLTNEETEVSLFEVVPIPGLSRRRGDLVLMTPNSKALKRSAEKTSPEADSDSSLLPPIFQNLLTQARSLFVLDRPLVLANDPVPDNVQDAADTHSPREVDWFGEIIELGLDGELTIRLGALRDVRDIQVPIERALVVVGGDDDSVLDPSVAEEEDTSSWDDSMSLNSEGAIYTESVEYEGGERLDADGGDDLWMTEDEDAMNGDSESESSPIVAANTARNDFKSYAESTHIDIQPEESRFSTYPDMPSRFEVLHSTVSSDQHFINQNVQLSASLMRRIRKEHQVMQTSLPDGTWVRTWSDRLDLLRILIIGPRGTPYEHAPFVVDFQFRDSFPTTPPAAFFHSWTGGVGRINPNLYEDGKICLSLLGTWPGEAKNEGWSAGRSSMLQIVVSLMGLVLVKEPYYSKFTTCPLSCLSSGSIIFDWANALGRLSLISGKLLNVIGLIFSQSFMSGCIRYHC